MAPKITYDQSSEQVRELWDRVDTARERYFEVMATAQFARSGAGILRRLAGVGAHVRGRHRTCLALA